MKPILSFKPVTGLLVLSVAVAMLTVSPSASPALAGGPMRIRRLNAAASSLLGAPASTGGTCLQDLYTASGLSQTLGCTANDVKIAKVVNVRKLDGTPLISCNAGSTINFIADFLVQTSSNSSRSNVGLFFATDPTQPNALTGTCADNIIPPEHGCGYNDTVTCGSTHYDEFDASPDNCGDTSSSDPPVCLDANNIVVACPAPAGGSTFPSTQVVTVEVDNFSCTAASGTNQLDLPNCTSWQIPGKTTLCEASSPGYAYPYNTAGKAEALPGSPSKCNCSTIQLPVTVQSPGVTVSKNCQTNNGSSSVANPPAQGAEAECTISPEGGSVTYTVDIANSSNFGSVVVDQICDSAYGNIFTVSGYGGPACLAGSVGSVSSTTCSAMTIAEGGDQSCTFTVSQAENQTVTDTVNVSGHGLSSGTFGPVDSNPAQVTSGEADTTATITKGLDSIQAGCATARFNVDVKNTSASGTDETVSLSVLTDSVYGDITKSTETGNSSVLGTTCGVASGVGSLSGSTGAGTLSATIAVGGDYICQFDAQFCGPLTAISLPGGGSCSGITQTDHVTGTLTGDEGAGDVVSYTYNTLTAYVCLSSSSSSSP